MANFVTVNGVSFNSEYVSGLSKEEFNKEFSHNLKDMPEKVRSSIYNKLKGNGNGTVVKEESDSTERDRDRTGN